MISQQSIDRLRQVSRPATAEDLRAEVEAHLAEARAVGAQDPFVDLRRAEQVAAACIALTDALHTIPEDQRHWVTGACRYFADTDDDEDDFASIVGFDDDAEVVNYVADKLGLSHIFIDLG